MKILHICMCDPYAEDWSYHRNTMSEQNHKDGHDVAIITTQYTMGKDGESLKVKPGTFYTTSGIKVVRLQDRIPHLPLFLQDRIRWVAGLYPQLVKEKPDVVMVHNTTFISLKDIVKYKKEYPDVFLCGDNHGDYFNSARTFLSREILNKRFYRRIVRKNFKYFDKFLYISYETKKFFEEMYGVDLKDAVFSTLSFPIMGQEEKDKLKKRIRKELQLGDNTILLVHSGKLEERKKTKEILRALKQIPEANLKLIIIGSIPEEDRSVLEPMLEDDVRVEFLGWKNAEKLREYLAAADLYLQPGTQSVTFMNALSSGTPVMIYPHISYEPYCNGCEFLVKTEEDIVEVLKNVLSTPEILNEKSIAAFQIAQKYFDVKKSAAELYR